MPWSVGKIGFGTAAVTLPALPAARVGHVAGWISGKLYVAGGSVAGSISATGIVYDPASNAWSSIASMSTARQYASAGVISGKLYVTGGSSGSGPLNSLEAYDPSTNSWTTLAAPSTIDGVNGWAALRATYGVISGKLYVAGGFTNHSSSGDTETTAYDPSTNTWASVAVMPEGRIDAGSAVYSGKLYSIGGNTPVSTGGTSDLRIFTPGSGWVSGTSMSVSTYTNAGGTLGSTIYSMGGRVSGGISANVYAYNTSAGTWSSGTSMPEIGAEFPAASDGTYLWVTGGTGGTATGTRFERFDGSTWSTTSSGGGGAWD